MEELDRDLQRRVWQRVQGKGDMPPLGKQNVKPWILAAQENAAAYQHLARTYSGKDAEQLKRLHQESGKCIACMKGICRLRGEKVKIAPLPQTFENQRNLLEKCYHRERRLWEQLEQQAADPEHGVVYARLARQAQEHCVTIMELLGRRE